MRWIRFCEIGVEIPFSFFLYVRERVSSGRGGEGGQCE